MQIRLILQETTRRLMSTATQGPESPTTTSPTESLSARKERWRIRIQEAWLTYWPKLGSRAAVKMDRRARQRNGTHVFYGRIIANRTNQPFCIKWVPGADPKDLELTETRLDWWHAHHVVLGSRVPRIIACWPDECALLMTQSVGIPFGRYLRWPSCPILSRTRKRLDRFGAAFGEWLRAFASGTPPYAKDVQPLLGQNARRKSDGSLTVDAQRLLVDRIEQGHRAAHSLAQAGVRAARNWSERFDLCALERAFTKHEPAGFVHGDVKPDNLLVSESDFSLIDWWATPRVSWPLTDVANFAGNLRLYGESPGATRLWNSFRQGYFATVPDERSRKAIELISSILCMAYYAARIGRRASRNPLVRRRRRFVTDVLDRRPALGLCT